jgi:hypothetical protein
MSKKIGKELDMIKQGSKWDDGNGKVFRVIQIVQIEGHTWIHYINDRLSENETREYSCYQESFLSRFNPLPE